MGTSASQEGGLDTRSFSWGTGQTRCYVEASVTTITDTAMYISFSGKVRSGNDAGTAYRLSGYGVTCTVSTSAGGSCSASASYNYQNWVAGCSGGIGVSRTHTTHEVTVTCSYSSYNGASNSGSVSVSITISGQKHSIITCNANGGTGGPSKIDKWAGEDLSIPSSIPTRTNYRFDGWSTDPKATTPTYLANKTYTGTKDESYTLYAVWTQLYIYPTVKFVEGHRVDSPTSTQESALGTYARFEFSWNVDTTIYSDNLLSTYQATALLSDNSTPTCAITGTTSGTSGTVYISIPIATNLSGTVTFSVTDTAMEGEASGNGSVGIGHIPLEFSNGGTSAGILNSAGDAESITLGNLRLSDVHDDDLVTIPLKQLRWVVEASENRNPHDGWVYNKYNDGTAECWYQPITILIQNVSWGQGWYYNKSGTSGEFNSYKYPFTWASAPLVQRWVIQTNAESNHHAVMVMPYTYGNIEYTGSVFYGSNGSDGSSRSYYDCVYAFGLWK